MLVIMEFTATEKEVARVKARIEELGYQPHPIAGRNSPRANWQKEEPSIDPIYGHGLKCQKNHKK